MLRPQECIPRPAKWPHNAPPSFIDAGEREYRTLRVLPLDNPATPGYLHRTIDDLSAAGLDALDGCVNGLDVEVKVPTRHRNLGRLGHHAAVAHLFVVALVEDAINAHCPHVHIASLGPTKELIVEIKPAFEVRCVEFVPTDGAGGGWCGAFRRRHRRVR